MSKLILMAKNIKNEKILAFTNGLAIIMTVTLQKRQCEFGSYYSAASLA